MSCGDTRPTSPAKDQIPTLQTPRTVPTTAPLGAPNRYKYDSKIADIYGLYYVRSRNGSDERKLILSDTNAPIPPKSNDPGEATLPGFYISHEKRLDFEEIEVVGNRIYFKTRESNGLVYEFRGLAHTENDPYFSEPIPVIKGTLRTINDGVASQNETITFGHAVVS